MKHVKTMLRLITLLAAASPATADWIVLNGLTYRDVYIREGRSAYFVHFPDTGEVMNVPRSGLATSDFGIDEDGGRRKALLDRWRANNPSREDSTSHREDVRRQASLARQNASAAAQASQGTAGAMAVRSYDLGETTLPKIILHSPSVLMAAPAASSFSPSRMGVPATPMRQPWGSGMGMTPGYGTPGVRGMGGFGGMGGGFGRDVTAITNISDLFFNINDGLVGEAPGMILAPYVFLR